MIKHGLFLKWWLFIVVVAVGEIYIFTEGGLVALWELDATKLSFLLIALFSIMSAWCGYKTWRVSRFLHSGESDEYLAQKIDHLVEVGWFASDLCLTIGMIGTVTGFIMMLANFSTIDVANIKTIENMIKGLGSGMSTALYTTLIGLICSVLLKIQYFNLGQAVEQSRK